MKNYYIANLFGIEALNEVCKANYTFVSIKNNIQFDFNQIVSVKNISRISTPKIICINNFCVFNTWKIIDYIENKFSEGFKLILPQNISYPLELIPFCMMIDSWSINFIQSYIASRINNLKKFIDSIGVNSFICQDSQWSSNGTQSFVLNCIQYNLDNIFTMMIDKNYKLGII